MKKHKTGIINRQKIIFYGASWCPDCLRAKKYLDEHHIQYEYINIEEDEKAAEEVIKINKGLRSIPTIVFPNGAVLVEPNNDELMTALKITNKT